MTKSRLRRTALAAFAAPLVLALAACGSDGADTSTTATAEPVAKIAPPAGKAWGEVVTACVVAGTETEAALRKACEGLEPAARPRRYVFVPVLPTNASGKPDRDAIAKLTA